MNEATARAQLQSMTAWDAEPTLTAAEVQRLLDMHRMVDVYGVLADAYASWAASSPYIVGQLVVPTVRNGHFYNVTVSDGASGPTEPVWPLTSGGAVVLDGVTYTEAGSAPWSGRWALNMAAAEGWRWKAGKCAGRFSFSSEVNSFQRRQIHEMCLQMAAQYDKGGLSTIQVDAGSIFDPVIGNVNGAP